MDLQDNRTSRSIYNTTLAGRIATNRIESTTLNREQRTDGRRDARERLTLRHRRRGEGGQTGGGGSDLSEARRVGRGSEVRGVPFYFRRAAAAASPPQWDLPRALAVRSGGDGGFRAPRPRGGPHGGRSVPCLCGAVPGF
jgi:hypothetical protein